MPCQGETTAKDNKNENEKKFYVLSQKVLQTIHSEKTLHNF